MIRQTARRKQLHAPAHQPLCSSARSCLLRAFMLLCCCCSSDVSLCAAGMGLHSFHGPQTGPAQSQAQIQGGTATVEGRRAAAPSGLRLESTSRVGRKL